MWSGMDGPAYWELDVPDVEWDVLDVEWDVLRWGGMDGPADWELDVLDVEWDVLDVEGDGWPGGLGVGCAGCGVGWMLRGW